MGKKDRRGPSRTGSNTVPISGSRLRFRKAPSPSPTGSRSSNLRSPSHGSKGGHSPPHTNSRERQQQQPHGFRDRPHHGPCEPAWRSKLQPEKMLPSTRASVPRPSSVEEPRSKSRPSPPVASVHRNPVVRGRELKRALLQKVAPAHRLPEEAARGSHAPWRRRQVDGQPTTPQCQAGRSPAQLRAQAQALLNEASAQEEEARAEVQFRQAKAATAMAAARTAAAQSLLERSGSPGTPLAEDAEKDPRDNTSKEKKRSRHSWRRGHQSRPSKRPSRR